MSRDVSAESYLTDWMRKNQTGQTSTALHHLRQVGSNEWPRIGAHRMSTRRSGGVTVSRDTLNASAGLDARVISFAALLAKALAPRSVSSVLPLHLSLLNHPLHLIIGISTLAFC